MGQPSKIVWADLSLGYNLHLLGRRTTTEATGLENKLTCHALLIPLTPLQWKFILFQLLFYFFYSFFLCLLPRSEGTDTQGSLQGPLGSPGSRQGARVFDFTLLNDSPNKGRPCLLSWRPCGDCGASDLSSDDVSLGTVSSQRGGCRCRFIVVCICCIGCMCDDIAVGIVECEIEESSCF